jgi:protease I
MSGRLDGQHIALLIEQGFELREVNEPRQSLQQEGAEVVLIGSSARTPYQDKVGTTTIISDLGAGAIKMKDFQALVIPGGHAPDRMRMRHAMVDLATDAMATGKLVAAICHGPQVLISADALRGRTLTCWPWIAMEV